MWHSIDDKLIVTNGYTERNFSKIQTLLSEFLDLSVWKKLHTTCFNQSRFSENSEKCMWKLKYVCEKCVWKLKSDKLKSEISESNFLYSIYTLTKNNNFMTLTLKAIINFVILHSFRLSFPFLFLSFPYYSLLFVDDVVIYSHLKTWLSCDTIPFHQIESY